MGVKMEAGLLFLAGCVLGQVCCLEEPTCSSRCEFEARISRQLAEIQHNLSSIRQERGTACRDGWVPFHGSCYLFADSDFVDFLGAEHHCRRYGAHLIHVNTEAENMFIKAELSKLHPKQWWLGIQDSELEAVWKFYGYDSVATFTEDAPAYNTRPLLCLAIQKRKALVFTRRAEIGRQQQRRRYF
ncbi:C-type lectin domain family 7 member A-like isoform X1 [Mya arenaria]|uniref:C-type lectin domain family 7 member A-like isoform X1 n=1 Tax=Mya arenaria TaxID=6604 RepID=UPI0022E17BC7|nr:C-type lectin domain family 7 member A-like isoform X1 [Mya arenaria]